MRQLGFKSRFIAGILDGSKTQTLRARSHVQVGDLVSARCRYDQPAFAILEVLGVDMVLTSDITELDARADGFHSLAELLQELKTLYPRLSGDYRWQRIRFVRTDSQPRIRGGLFPPDPAVPAEP
jgi:hypothetical protein